MITRRTGCGLYVLLRSSSLRRSIHSASPSHSSLVCPANRKYVGQPIRKAIEAALAPAWHAARCHWRRHQRPDRRFACHHNLRIRDGRRFYNGQCIGAVFGDTVGPPGDDARKLGEASVKSAQLLGIPSSGTTGGVDNGVTFVVFSGPQWVVAGTNDTLNDNAQALVQEALNTLGNEFGL
jgi:hypothetical protein